MKTILNNVVEKYFIDWAKKLVTIDTVITKEAHGDQSSVFKIHASNGDYFLKIASGLEKERDRLEWLNGKLPVPRIIGFATIDDKDALLLSALEGENLAVLGKRWPSEKIVDALAEVIHQFHSIDVGNCPFGIFDTDSVLVHGDACLPNFIFHDDTFSGYIDVGDAGIGNSEIDLSAALWSLQYNLGHGHGRRFLEKYGIKNVTDTLVETLRIRYEDTWSERGLSK